MIVGQTETYKTFVVLGLELASLKDVPWLGADVVPIASSIFVPGEGASGLKPRIGAWKVAHGLQPSDRLGLQILDGPVNLFDHDEVAAFIDEVILPHAPCNVTFDTQARCSAGADENSARDMGVGARQCLPRQGRGARQRQPPAPHQRQRDPRARQHGYAVWQWRTACCSPRPMTW